MHVAEKYLRTGPAEREQRNERSSYTRNKIEELKKVNYVNKMWLNKKFQTFYVLTGLSTVAFFSVFFCFLFRIFFGPFTSVSRQTQLALKWKWRFAWDLIAEKKLLSLYSKLKNSVSSFLFCHQTFYLFKIFQNVSSSLVLSHFFGDSWFADSFSMGQVLSATREINHIRFV